MKRYVKSSSYYIDEVNGTKIYWDQSKGVAYIYTDPKGKGRMDFASSDEAQAWILEHDEDSGVTSNKKVCAASRNGRRKDIRAIVQTYYEQDSWADVAGDEPEVGAEDIPGYEDFQHVMWLTLKRPYWDIPELPDPVELVETPRGMKAVQVLPDSETVEDVTDDIVRYHVNMPY